MSRLVCAVLLFAAVSVAAQGRDPFDKQSQGRLSWRLHTMASAGDRGDVRRLRAGGARLERGAWTARVVLELSDWSALKDVTAAVERLGGRVDATARPLLRATVPVARLRQLSATARVQRIREPYVPRPKQELPTIVSQGVDVTAADDFVALSGANGEGVTVGVLDGGFKGVAELIPSELPEGRVAATQFVLDHLESYESVHGSACAEIIHDMAPGASLLLAGFEDEVTWAQALDDLVNAGVRIISHSIGFDNLAVPNGDNFWSRKIDEVASKGVLVVTAAGNEGENYYQGQWQDADRDRFLEYTGGGELLPLGIGAGGSITVRWDDTFGASSHDYDVLVVRQGFADNPELSEDNPNIVAASLDTQDGDDLPLEIAQWELDELEQLYVVILRDQSSSQMPTQRFWVYSTNGIAEGYRSPTGSLSMPGDARGAVTVGAFQWETRLLEPYSSRGPTADGRVKPDITAPDQVTTRSYYGDGLDEMPGFFAGTSAATPHVAGAAALMLSYRPNLTREELVMALTAATDSSMLVRQGQNLLKSNDWGWGRLSFNPFFSAAASTRK